MECRKSKKRSTVRVFRTGSKKIVVQWRVRGEKNETVDLDENEQVQAMLFDRKNSVLSPLFKP